MRTMPKKIDPEVKARAVRLVTDHQSGYPSLTAASAAVAKQLGVGAESVRRWVIQAEIDGGQRQGATSSNCNTATRPRQINKPHNTASTVRGQGRPGLDPDFGHGVCWITRLPGG
jgi:transposase